MKLRWRELVIAFLLAVGIWYIVTGSEKVVSQIEVRADYRGLPQGLVVRGGTVSKVSVRVRASVGMLHSISSRDFAFFVDLSPVKKGENILPININQLVLPGGVEVIDVSPSRIYLEVDTAESKSVPLVAEIRGELANDYTAEAKVIPPEVKISGASSQVAGINRLVMPVAVDNTLLPGTTESKRLIPLPEGVDCTPSEATISLHIGIRRKLASVSRPVIVAGPDQLTLSARPDKVQITLAVPDSLAGKVPTNDGIKATVQLENDDDGSYVLPVQVTLPEGIELVKVEPARVVVIVQQKQPAHPRQQPVRAPAPKPQAPKPQAAKPQTAKPQTAKPQSTKPQTTKPQPAKPHTAAPRAGR